MSIGAAYRAGLGAALILATAAAPARGQMVVRAWLGGAHATMDSLWAIDRGMGARGGGFQLGLGARLLHVIVVDGEFGALFPDDKRPFSQSTVCIGDCSSNAGGSQTSSILLYTWTAAVGLQTPRVGFWKVGVSPGVRLGAATYVGRRGIGNCSDCAVQDLDLRAGPYGEYGVTVLLGRPDRSNSTEYVTLTAAYRSFLGSSSHFENHLVLHLGVELQSGRRER
jgi:hypothetical protein